MKTFIFIKHVKANGKIEKVIVGMVHSDIYPSMLIHDKESKFYACDCIEVTEDCYIQLGIYIR